MTTYQPKRNFSFMDSSEFDTTNDKYNWKLMKNGDQEALAELFRRYYTILFDYGFKICRREEMVKDSIQEIFALIWERRNNISEVRSVKTYLLISLRRNLLRTMQQKRKRDYRSQEMTHIFEDYAFSPEEFAIVEESRSEESILLKKALRKIPPRIREALYLKAFGGLSYQQISQVMEISPQVARNYVCEAFHRLRQITTETT